MRELPSDAPYPPRPPAVWTVEFSWTPHEPEPPQVAILLDAIANDIPALLDGQRYRVVDSDMRKDVGPVSYGQPVVWTRKTVKFSLAPAE